MYYNESMHLHKLTIDNFRGIKQLTWLPEEGLTCLIGPGDSAKTTLLDALGLALTTRTSIGLSDADFYNGDVATPIKIEVIITDLSNELISLDGLGAYVCGIAPDGTVKSDPEIGDKKALAVRFTADESLESIWEVFKPNAPEVTPRHLTVSLRAKFGVFRVDERVDTHLRWGRGSALAAITAGVAGANSTTVGAQRAARQAVFNSEEITLTDAAAKVKAASNTFGASNFQNLRVGLDPQALNTGYGLVLHDGEVPLTSSGLGTRRLTSLGIQEARTVGANIILIDEIETGLEPHRLAHLLRLLKKRAEEGTQVIMTTHAPLVVENFGTDGLAIVRRSEGVVTVKQIPAAVASLDNDAMQRMIRSGPSAMLARQIIVVEGSTEMGVFRALFDHWDEEQVTANKGPLAVFGTAVRNGGSDEQALKRAECLAELGYLATALIDSDNALEDAEAAATAAGAGVIRWGDDTALEGRVATDLPEVSLHKLIKAAIEVRPEEESIARSAVLNAIGAKLHGTPTLTSIDPTQWAADHSIPLADIRDVIGKVANKNKWFKDEQRGAVLGELIYELWSDIAATPLGQRMTEVRTFAYPEADEEEE
jgi:putative ATP-dependent endonuclease of OLD family